MSAAFGEGERSPNEECCMRTWENCYYILSRSLLLKPIVALVSSLRVCFSFPGSKMKPTLDSPGMLEESLIHVKLCVFEKVCINEMYTECTQKPGFSMSILPSVF